MRRWSSRWSSPSRSIRATVWETVGPECPSRSAMRARIGAMPASWSSNTVFRYISVVAMRSPDTGPSSVSATGDVQLIGRADVGRPGRPGPSPPGRGSPTRALPGQRRAPDRHRSGTRRPRAQERWAGGIRRAVRLVSSRSCLAARRSGEVLDDLAHEIGGLGGGLAHLDAGGLEGLLLRLRGAGGAGHDRAGVAHRLALGGGEARDVADDRLGDVGLDVLGRAL